MKHELVVTFSTLGGSRDIVISSKAKIAFCVTCVGLVGVITVMGVALVSTLSALAEAKTQLSTLHKEPVVQQQKSDLIPPLQTERVIASNAVQPLQVLRIKVAENNISAPRPVSAPAPAVTPAPRQPAERTLLFNLIPNGSPLKKASRISSYFGRRMHPILHRIRNHRGIDFGARTGTPVYATASGIVGEAKKNSRGYGQQIVVQHGLGFSSRYAHLSHLSVKAGDYVAKGTLLGQSGNSGRSTGPHLHYEVLYRGKNLDPLNFVRWSNTNFQAIFTEEKGVPWASLIKQSQWSQIASLPFWPKVVQ
ncbi:MULTISPECIES: M23 family metallopeptidase [unclassified Pseudomonas]|uniref:M23 family metallopeptidase n=1 Tax=unclassified Pseudomonas TaxID=196821 RepID=UPI001032FBB7|nr:MULTISPECIES: M23 family metallopeptidase [unclassified Pseudomonas]